MNSPRWRKLLRDLQAARGRMAMMVVAIAVSVFAIGTILGAYTILMREISRNYLGTQPASALLELDHVDDALVAAVRARPEIADAEASDWLVARATLSPAQTLPVQLFVIRDFTTLRINAFRPATGAWPPPDGTLLLEREALTLINAQLGDTLTIQTPNGAPRALPITGTVHDPGLAPAWQEQTVYAYISPATLALLGEGDTLHLLKIVVKDPPRDSAALDGTVSTLALWLQSQGYTVEEIRIPPYNLHPHQSQMTSVLTLLLIFSFMALVLSSILTAAMIGGLLAQQIRQIGIMKALGARAYQITGLYLVLVAVLGLVAVALGVLPGLWLAQAFASVVARLLNFTLYSTDVPAWVFAVEVLAGVLIPLLITLNPILRTSSITVRETLNDYGVSNAAFGTRGLDHWLSQIRGLDHTLLLAFRNTFRRRGRLVLTLGLLSAAGGMFMTGLNVQIGWEQYLRDAAHDRHYDLEVRLNRAQPEAELRATLASIPGVQRIEAWSFTPAALYRPDGLDIVRTYPDGGHGSFTLRAAPPTSTLMDVHLMSGRWLTPDDTDAVVLNQNALALFPTAKLGERVQLTVAGQSASFVLVGTAQQILSPATAYVTPARFALATNQPASTLNAVRIVLDASDPATVNQVARAIELALDAQGVSTKVVISESMLADATSGHVLVFIAALLLMSAVMGVVGALGLTSSMSTSVIERTREFGIMRALGARSQTVLHSVISEGVFIGLLSWVLALALSVPLSLGIGYLLGQLAFRAALPLILSPLGLGLWLAIIVLGSLAASAYPAQQASALTIRETLAYV